MRVIGAVTVAALLGVVAAAQDGNKAEATKERLPFHWKQLDLTEEQKAKYKKLSGETEAKKEKLSVEIDRQKGKLKGLQTEYKKLDAGDEFAEAVLTPPQREKLTAIRADAAKKTAEKSAKKAARLELAAKKPANAAPEPAKKPEAEAAKK